MDAIRADTGEPFSAHRFSDGRSLTDVCREVFGCAPCDVELLGERSNNCGAFKLRVKNKKVKCYECESADRAKMVEQATDVLLDAGVPIPRVFAVADHVVFAQWVSGKPLPEGQQRAMWQRMASYQAKIHQVSISTSETNNHQFMHLDWLLRRLASASRKYACPSHVQALSQSLRRLTPPELKAGVLQPDFIKSNLVVTKEGELIVIDNELLSLGLGFEFDILNASHAIAAGDKKKQRQYLDDYAECGDLGTLDTNAAFWDMCHLAKLAGKRFLFGDATIGNVCLELLDLKLRGAH